VATVGAVWLFGGSSSGVRAPNRVSAQAPCYACHL
jgi:hypothetical protein